jgi:DNA-directed RNA polymerase I, II, and III subunit RPABC1
MSLNPELIPVKKDSETIRREVLTNIIKIMNSRGLILEKNIKKHLDDIKKINDDDTYIFKLDKEVKSDSQDKKYKEKFNGLQLSVKIIHQKIQGITKMPIIKDFVTQYTTSHKIFVFDGISDKAKTSLTDMPNTEVFEEPFLMLNIIDHIDSPRYELLTEDEEKEVMDSYILKKKEMKKILTSDPIVFYFNLKRGNIIRIIRPSEQSGSSVDYRIVAKGMS